MPRILVIDDCLTTVAQLRQHLNLAGYEVEHLEVAVLLPRLIRQRPPDLIILDLQMPMLSGPKLGALVRKYQSRCIPIIIHSSLSLIERERAREQVGALSQLEKGCPPELLRAAVSDALTRESAA